MVAWRGLKNITLKHKYYKGIGATLTVLVWQIFESIFQNQKPPPSTQLLGKEAWYQNRPSVADHLPLGGHVIELEAELEADILRAAASLRCCGQPSRQTVRFTVHWSTMFSVFLYF